MSNRVSGKKVFFKNASGQRIAGILQTPAGEGPFSAIVLCHGFKGRKEDPVLKAAADELVENGFLTLRFDYSDSTGESGGKFENATVTHYLRDAEKALSFTRSLKKTRPDRIGMAGHSLGGLLCGLIAARKKINAAVLFAPVSEWLGTRYGEPGFQKEWREKGHAIVHSYSRNKDFRINYSFNKDAVKYSLYKSAKKISCPVLIVHGTGDESAPFSESEKLFRLLKKPKKLVAVSGADHRFGQKKWLERAAEETTGWFIEWIKCAPST